MKKLLSAVALAIATTCITLMAAVAHATVANSHLMQALPNPQVNHPASLSDVFSDAFSDVFNNPLDNIQLAHHGGTHRHISCEANFDGSGNPGPSKVSNNNGSSYNSSSNETVIKTDAADARHNCGLTPTPPPTTKDSWCTTGAGLSLGGNGNQIVILNSGVYDCRDVTQASCNQAPYYNRHDGSSCVPCSGATPLLSGNTCVATTGCPAGQAANAAGNACEVNQTGCNNNGQIFDSGSSSCMDCQASQYISSNTCTACPTGQAPTADKTACEATIASCNANGQRFDSGSSSCMDCQTNEFISSNTCTACSAGQTPTADKTACEATMASCNANGQIFDNGSSSCMDCQTNEYISSNTCTACSAGQAPTADKTACETTMASCNANGQIFDNGSSSCMDCQTNEFISSNTCTACSAGQTPTADKTACEATMASCNANGQIFDNGSSSCMDCQTNEFISSNTCTACSAGQTPTADKTACEATIASCNGINQILPGGQTSCQACVSPTALRNDNDCVATCPNDKTTNSANNACIPASETSCNANNQIFTNNRCQPCSGATPMRVGNMCQSCPAGQAPDGSGGCETTMASCNANNQMYVGGSCRSCPADEVLNGNACESCPTNQEAVGGVCRDRFVIFGNVSPLSQLRFSQSNVAVAASDESWDLNAGRVSFEWLVGTPPNDFARNGITTAMMRVNRQNLRGKEYVALRLVYTPNNGNAPQFSGLTVTRKINEDPQGQLRITPNTPLNIGTILTLDASDIRDANTDGIPQLSAFSGYQWQLNGRNLANGTGSTYTLTIEDVNAIVQGGRVNASVLFTDGLGYTAPLLVNRTFDLQSTLSVTLLTATDRAVSATFKPNPNFDLVSVGYHWYIGEQGDDISQYTEVTSGVSNVYHLPDTPIDYAKPYMRVQTRYAFQSGGRTFNRRVTSSPQQIVGLARGNVQLIGSGKQNGARYEVNLDNLRNVNGSPVRAEDLRYVWQAVGQNYVLALATTYSNTYELSSADFAKARQLAPSLSVSMSDRSGVQSAVDLSVEPILINSALEGVLEVWSDGYGGGDVFIADTSRLQDDNVIATISYNWSQSRGPDVNGQVVYTPIANANGASYTVRVGDLFGGTPRLKAMVEVVDEFGYVGRREKVIQFLQSPLQGRAAIRLSGYTVGATARAEVSSLYDSNGTDNISYEWLTGGGASGGSSNYVSRSNRPEYVVQATHFGTNSPILRLVVSHVDSIGGVTRQTIDHNMNAPTRGAPVAQIVDNIVAVGSTLNAMLSEISDANGVGAQAQVTWRRNNSLLATSDTYQLVANDVGAINMNNGDFVMVVTYFDALGFQTTYTVNIAATQVNIVPYADRLAAVVSTLSNGGALSYVWENSSTEGGAYQAIAANGNGSTFAIPSDYDYSRPYIRLRVRQQGTSSSSSSVAYSLPVRVGGVVSGRVVISNSSQSPLVYRANLDNMRNVLGFVPRVGELSYQWQVAESLNGTYTNINNMTSNTYTVRNADIATSTGDSYLRVVVRNATRTGGAYTAPSSDDINALAVNINSPTEGRAVVVGGGAYLAEGKTLSVEIINLRDNNGVGALSYQWYWRNRQQGGAYRMISGATDATYVVAGADFGNVGTPELAVSVQHTDALGFVHQGDSSFHALAVFRHASQQAPVGNVQVQANTSQSRPRLANSAGDFAPNSVLTVAADIIDGNGTGRLQYTWERANSQLPLPKYVPVNGGDDGTITLLSTDWGGREGYDLLRARVMHMDAFGDETEFVTPPFLVDRPTQGEANVVAEDSINGIIAGRMLTVSTALVDENNVMLGVARNMRYQWINGFGSDIPNADQLTYRVRSIDASLAAEGKYVSVRVVHEDSLGFAHTLVVGFATVTAIQKQTAENVAAVLNAALAYDSMNMINTHLNKSDAAKAVTRAQFNVQINQDDVHDISDLSRALARHTNTDSGSTNINFALEDFALSYTSRGFGGRDAGRWSGWARGSLTDMSGKRTGDNNIQYSGESFSFYAGVDHDFGDTKLGLAVGVNNSELKTALHDDQILNDKVMRDMNSVLPYLELKGALGNLRLVGGVGSGEMNFELRNRNDSITCEGVLDMQWYMGGVSGDVRLIDHETLDLSLEGGLNHSSSEVEAGYCSNNVLALHGADSSGGEGVLGLQGGYSTRFENGRGLFRPFISINGRRQFGHLSDDVVYDFGGGVVLETPGGVTFRGEYKRQFTDDTSHNREGYNGLLSYTHGSWTSSYRATVRDSLGIGTGTSNFADNPLIHRWELQSSSNPTWANSFDIKLYAEHVREGADSLGAQVQANL